MGVEQTITITPDFTIVSNPSGATAASQDTQEVARFYQAISFQQPDGSFSTLSRKQIEADLDNNTELLAELQAAKQTATGSPQLFTVSYSNGRSINVNLNDEFQRASYKIALYTEALKTGKVIRARIQQYQRAYSQPVV